MAGVPRQPRVAGRPGAAGDARGVSRPRGRRLRGVPAAAGRESSRAARSVGTRSPSPGMRGSSGGNDAGALAANEDAFHNNYCRYGFVRTARLRTFWAPSRRGRASCGVSTSRANGRGAAAGASHDPGATGARHARCGALGSQWNARPRRAEAALRSMIAADARWRRTPGSSSRARFKTRTGWPEAQRRLQGVAVGARVGPPRDPFHKKVGLEIAWERDPAGRSRVCAVSSDSDGRDALEIGRPDAVSFEAPVRLVTSTAGSGAVHRPRVRARL